MRRIRRTRRIVVPLGQRPFVQRRCLGSEHSDPAKNSGGLLAREGSQDPSRNSFLASAASVVSGKDVTDEVLRPSTLAAR